MATPAPVTPVPVAASSKSPLVTKEHTPNSLLLKLHLPAQRLRDLIAPDATTIAGSINSSPPPSSPVASTAAAENIRPAMKKKAPAKQKKTKIVIGGDGKPVEVAAPAIGASRLGPKSNAGAINENLRNLDRSGKPCRRWHRRPLTVKSLYGTKWRCPAWFGEATVA